MKLDPCLTLYKMNSKQIKNTNIRTKMIKLLRKKWGKLHDTGSGNDSWI